MYLCETPLNSGKLCVPWLSLRYKKIYKISPKSFSKVFHIFIFNAALCKKNRHYTRKIKSNDCKTESERSRPEGR